MDFHCSSLIFSLSVIFSLTLFFLFSFPYLIYTTIKSRMKSSHVTRCDVLKSLYDFFAKNFITFVHEIDTNSGPYVDVNVFSPHLLVFFFSHLTAMLCTCKRDGGQMYKKHALIVRDVTAT